MGQITLDPLPIDHQVSSCLLFGFILKLGLCFFCLWLLVFFPLFRCCMFCFLFATNAFLDGIGTMWWKIQGYYKILLGEE
jgi:hypothetical protein